MVRSGFALVVMTIGLGIAAVGCNTEERDGSALQFGGLAKPTGQGQTFQVLKLYKKLDGLQFAFRKAAKNEPFAICAGQVKFQAPNIRTGELEWNTSTGIWAVPLLKSKTAVDPCQHAGASELQWARRSVLVKVPKEASLIQEKRYGDVVLIDNGVSEELLRSGMCGVEKCTFSNNSLGIQLHSNCPYQGYSYPQGTYMNGLTCANYIYGEFDRW